MTEKSVPMIGLELQSALSGGFQGVGSDKDVQSRFYEIGKLIMSSHKLEYGCGERQWRITALELYLNTKSDSAVWRDPYTHGLEAQRQSCTWYVHKNGSRAPIYSGIDITCGSTEKGIYGGILIRELEYEQRWVFQRIVRGSHFIKSRKDNKWSDAEKALIISKIHNSRIDDGILRLVPITPQNDKLWIGTRIGLKKRSDALESFRCAPLRIAIGSIKRPNTSPL